jgi:hypothetical protein
MPTNQKISQLPAATSSSGNDLYPLVQNGQNYSITFTALQAALALSGSGITQLTGDVTAGPGSGVQSATISSTTVTSKLLAGYTIGANTPILATDSILSAFGKIQSQITNLPPPGTGTVTTVSVVSANGFAGTVANATSAPAITLTTTITGILYGNGTSIAAAVPSNFPLLNQNTTGTAFNVTTTSNSTITTLSSLSLPASQLTGIGNLTDVGTDGITVTGGTGAVIGSGTSIAQHVADTTHNGYLSSTDWNTFNNKQASGNYITALIGDGTATGPGSATFTLATVNSNIGSFGSSTSIPTFAVNAKGLMTAASGNPVVAPAGTLTGSTLASNVINSGLTSLGTQSQALNMGGFQINAVASPVVSSDAATKGYVDAAINGLMWKGPVNVFANTNIPLTGGATLTIDGYSVQNGNTVILSNQTTASQNYVYVASGIGTAYTLTAVSGFEAPTAIGDAYLILDGTQYASTAYQVNAISPNVTFIQFAGPNNYSFTAPLILTGNTVTITQSSTSSNGYLSSTDWNTFNNKQSTLTFGNFTDSTSGVDGITIIGGTGAVIGSGTSISQAVASSSQNGYLNSANWTTFNDKQNALIFGNVTDGSDGILTFTGSTGAVIGSGLQITVAQSTTSTSGYLSSTDWNTFNSKQSALTFSDSILNTSGTITLVGDTATPGASQYYGTNGSSTLGYYSLPSGSSLTDTQIAFGSPSNTITSSANLTYATTIGLNASATDGSTFSNVLASSSSTIEMYFSDLTDNYTSAIGLTSTESVFEWVNGAAGIYAQVLAGSSGIILANNDGGSTFNSNLTLNSSGSFISFQDISTGSDQGLTLQDRIVYLGLSTNNQNQLVIDDAADRIYTFNSGTQTGLILDFANDEYYFGNGSGLYLTANNTAQLYNLSSYYESTRNDTGSFAPVNFLYTDSSGNLFSAPLSTIAPVVNGPFTLADNQSSPAPITGMSIDHTLYSAAWIDYEIYLLTTGSVEQVEHGTIDLSYMPVAAVWRITNDFVFDTSGVTFSMSGDQVQYTSTNNGGVTTFTITWLVRTV